MTQKGYRGLWFPIPSVPTPTRDPISDGQFMVRLDAVLAGQILAITLHGTHKTRAACRLPHNRCCFHHPHHYR